jgi:hypothetical protein
VKALIIVLAAVAALLASPVEARLHRDYSQDSGKPAQCGNIPWCGCWLRIQKGISDVRYNAASWWHHYGQRVAGPVVGAVARLNHHVGIVVGITPHGDPVVTSGNHRHQVATAVYPKHKVIEYRIGNGQEAAKVAAVIPSNHRQPQRTLRTAQPSGPAVSKRANANPAEARLYPSGRESLVAQH